MSGESAAEDLAAGLPDMARQRHEEGRGWANMKATTADNTYTGKGGSKSRLACRFSSSLVAAGGLLINSNAAR